MEAELPAPRRIDGALRAADVHDADAHLDVGGAFVYERVVPAVPASVGRVREQLGDALARHDLAAGRRDDIALVLTEAATNAVWHGYLDTNPGPLYVSARLMERSLILAVIDRGRGMRPRSDSPGLGLGMRVMARLADDLRISSDPCGVGTCVQATFEQATSAPGRHARVSARDRAEMLREYVQLLAAATASLHQDTRAVLAQAEQAVAHARRQQRERARR